MNLFCQQLRPASFRGIAFQVSDSDVGAGRRVQVHEYPQRDLPWIEDLGRATRAISFEGFLIGSDYIAQANRLLAALESAGPGTLGHPWFGSMQVCLAQPARVRFDAGLGMATVSMSFVEAGDLSFPTPTQSTQAVSRLTADGLASAAISDFASRFTVSGYQSFVSAAAQGQLGTMLGFLGSGQLGQLLGLSTSTANDITQVAAWSEAVKVITGASRSSSMQPLGATASVTPSRQQINANSVALYGLGRQLLLAQVVGISSLVGSDQDNAQAGLAALTQRDQGTSGQTTVSLPDVN